MANIEFHFHTKCWPFFCLLLLLYYFFSTSVSLLVSLTYSWGIWLFFLHIFQDRNSCCCPTEALKSQQKVQNNKIISHSKNQSKWDTSCQRQLENLLGKFTFFLTRKLTTSLIFVPIHSIFNFWPKKKFFSWSVKLKFHVNKAYFLFFVTKTNKTGGFCSIFALGSFFKKSTSFKFFPFILKIHKKNTESLYFKSV